MESTISRMNPLPRRLNAEPKVTFISSCLRSSTFVAPSHSTERIETIPKTRKRSFQSPNFSAKKPARGAPIMEPMALMNCEKLRKLEVRFDGTTSTSNGLAETWTMVFPIPNSAKPNNTIEKE